MSIKLVTNADLNQTPKTMRHRVPHPAKYGVCVEYDTLTITVSRKATQTGRKVWTSEVLGSTQTYGSRKPYPGEVVTAHFPHGASGIGVEFG